MGVDRMNTGKMWGVGSVGVGDTYMDSIFLRQTARVVADCQPYLGRWLFYPFRVGWGG